MKRIERQKTKVRKSDQKSIFHDSRQDVRTLGQAINAIAEKQNEIIDAVNQLIDAENRRTG